MGDPRPLINPRSIVNKLQGYTNSERRAYLTTITAIACHQLTPADDLTNRGTYLAIHQYLTKGEFADVRESTVALNLAVRINSAELVARITQSLIANAQQATPVGPIRYPFEVALSAGLATGIWIYHQRLPAELWSKFPASLREILNLTIPVLTNNSLQNSMPAVSWLCAVTGNAGGCFMAGLLSVVPQRMWIAESSLANYCLNELAGASAAHADFVRRVAVDFRHLSAEQIADQFIAGAAAQ